MIQFNLLPDVKKEYVKAKRMRRTITTVSIFSSVVAIVVVGIMFSVVNIAQKKYINDLGKDIQASASEIENTKDLDKILTVQNQLSLLPGLHASKPELSRVFNYIRFVTPETAKVATLDVDMATSEMILSGSADSIATINRFVDNLKTVKFVTSEDGENLAQPYTQVTTGLSGDNESATFKINLIFDPIIFDNTLEVTMKIGDQTTSSVVVEENQ